VQEPDLDMVLEPDLDMVLDRVPDAVPRARRQVTSHLVGSGLPDLAEDAALAVSELVTNATLHGIPPVHLRLRTTGSGVHLEVADGSPLGPEPLASGPDDTVGRGVAVVEAVSSAWGWHPTDTGKVVWCDLRVATGSDRGAPTRPVPDPRNTRGPEPTVEVPDVPVGILRKMLLHSEAQVRELSLLCAVIPADRGRDAVSDLCERARQVTTRGRLHRRLRAQALAADRAGRDRVDLSVETRWLTAEGQDYLRILDELDVQCRAERLLTLESPAVLRCLRRWLAGELFSGLRRADGAPAEPPRRFESVLAEEVNRLADGRNDIVRILEASPDAVVGIDHAGVIRVANRQTEQLFGYERRDLLGRPIEILVPEARRRAHATHRQDFAAHPRTRPMGAGLELSGRRRDGSEFPVDISLSVLDTELGQLVTASVRDLTGLRAMRESLRETHRVAEILQRSLLDAVPHQVAGVTVAARYQPAGSVATVGGDWHGVFPLADGLVGVTVGDVTGHGVDAASVMGRIRTWISARAWDQPSPAAVLRTVNQMLCRMSDPVPRGPRPAGGVGRPDEVFGSGDGVQLATALYGRLDPVHRTFDYAVAGHPGPISVDSASATAWLERPHPNLPLGLDPDLEFVDQHLSLPAEGKLVVFTDGLFEHRGISIEESLEAVAKQAAQLADRSVDQLADSLVALAPPSALPWSDDLALVVVQY
jgi:PAS domain S-box-containing protein